MYAWVLKNSMITNNEKRKIYIKEKLITSLSLLSLLLLLLFSEKVAADIQNGAILAFRSVVCSVFPFMILSDLITSFTGFNDGGILSSIFERVFRINGTALPAFLLGALGGFPIGIRIAVELLECGMISEDEYKRLISFIPLPSPAFIISAVGGMRGSISDGIALYIIMLLSSVFLGMLFGMGKHSSHVKGILPPRRYELTLSIKNAALSSLNICAFIALFSSVSGICEALFHSLTASAAISMVLEIGTAARLISSIEVGEEISFVMTAFAVCFSGLSMHAQACSFMPAEHTPMKRYLLSRLLMGIVGAASAALFKLISP